MNEMPDNTSNRLPRDEEIASRARAIFRHACEGTDSYHALRLGVARRAALDARATHSGLRMWAPLAGAAACCALVVGVAWFRPAAHDMPATTSMSSAPIVASQADTDDTPDIASKQMEMVQDLDFYRWLAAQPTVASAATGSGH